MKAIIAAIALISAAPSKAADQPETSNLAAEALRQLSAVLESTITLFRLELKDNEAVRFRNVFFRTTIGRDGRYHHGLCGEINAKNSFGGYSGWEPFFSSGRNLYIGTEPNTLDALVQCKPGVGHYWRETDIAPTLKLRVSEP